MNIDFNQNHFQLFGLPACYRLDLTQPGTAYRQTFRRRCIRTSSPISARGQAHVAAMGHQPKPTRRCAGLLSRAAAICCN